MTGKLYLCATPIGNLEDITYRVLKTLKEADLIAAEDTRHSIKLLNHFDIKTPMTSYHEYNKVEKAKYLVEKMAEGTNIALITDAGTPGISDPGEELVRQCYEAGIPVTSLPGPAACITALTMSGLPTRRFCFEAFLPAEKSDKKERQRILEELKKLKKRESVIIVSAKDSIEDKVTGLDLGADDYLAKPFHLAELHARVKSVIRRHQTDGNTEIEIENLTVRPDDHTVFINGEELKLNRKEFDLLYYFVTNPNRLINKTTLAEAVWGDNIDQADSLDFIYSQVKNLRKKMKTAEAIPEIKAVYGFGYKLITTPEA